MLPVAADAAEALFRVVDAAYEKRSAATIGSPRPRPSSSAKRDIEPRELRDRPAPLPAGATVAVVARALASSPRQIQRAFAELGGTSFSAYLREVRLRNAAALLARQPLTVWQVARLVGYRQPAHFAKAFWRRFGVTPAAYRDRAREAQATPTTTPDRGGIDR